MTKFHCKNLVFLGRGPYDLEIGEGCVCGISGSSGAGKSLLLRAMADLEPHEGALFLDGVSCDSFTGPAWRRRVAYLAAESLWWREHVIEHFCAEPSAEWLEQLNLPHDIMQRETGRLSSGEKQRLAVLRLLQNRPEVLLLDEPTASLDPNTSLAVEKFVGRYLEENRAACIWVSHDNEQLARVAAKRFEILPGGEMRQKQ